MHITPFIEFLRRRLGTFRTAQDGNVAIVFALAFIPVVGAVGAAVDYGRAGSAKTSVQAALDATALALFKDAATLTKSDLQQKAQVKFLANFADSNVKNVAITTAYDANAGSLVVSGTTSIATTIAGVLGISSIDISASATVMASVGKKLELALVLDNTGSMQDNGKIGALRSASHNLLGTLQKAAKNPGDIKVAIIPFTTEVNIGTGFANETWLDWSKIDSSGGGGDDCDWDEKERKGNKNNWTGGVIDRVQPYDVQDTSPTSDKNTWYPAVNTTLPAILPLTTDWTALNSKVDQMRANGRTNTTIGLVWGWHALTPNTPLAGASAPSSEVAKYIVFLTDGQNTQNRWSTNASQIDARTKAVCDNIKATGIKIYTIRVMEGNKSLLQGCASDTSMYYEVNQASQMDTVFAQIAGSLSTLRLTR